MAKASDVEGLEADTRLGEAAPRILEVRLADVREQERALAEKLEPDPVHDVRVAVRRLRAAIALLGTEELDRLDEEARAYGHALGALRDAHVQLAWAEELREKVEGAERPALELFAELFRGRAQEAEPRLREAIARWHTELAAGLDAPVHTLDPGGRLGGGRVRKRLQKAFDKVARAVDRLDDTVAPARAHELRIAAKKLRYMVEVVEPASPSAAAAAIAALKPAQQLLGDLHDCDERRKWLLELTDGDAVRMLDQHLEKERAQLGREAARTFGRWREERFVPRLAALWG